MAPVVSTSNIRSTREDFEESSSVAPGPLQLFGFPSLAFPMFIQSESSFYFLFL